MSSFNELEELRLAEEQLRKDKEAVCEQLTTALISRASFRPCINLDFICSVRSLKHKLRQWQPVSWARLMLIQVTTLGPLRKRQDEHWRKMRDRRVTTPAFLAVFVVFRNNLMSDLIRGPN
jgi:hypothetical protein